MPMWQRINNGNWKIMEDTIRKLAFELKLDLDVYAGGIDQLTLLDYKNEPKQIFLYDPIKTNVLNLRNPRQQSGSGPALYQSGSSDLDADELFVHPEIRNIPNVIPVPKILFKVVYSKVQKSGIVFLTVNNPYVQSLNGFQICTDICDRLHYVTWNGPNHEGKGLSYCCEIDDFRRAYNYLPPFPTVKLLDGMLGNKQVHEQRVHELHDPRIHGHY